MEVDVLIQSVEGVETSSGKIRFVGHTDPDEVAWNTAVEAAPWMLGSREPQEEIPPEELYEKLEPFKRLVADDIRQGTPPADD
jgi:hypothetical protein